jgi:hypothetical protein
MGQEKFKVKNSTFPLLQPGTLNFELFGSAPDPA